MIILDSDRDIEWGGKNILIQYGTLILLKDADFYHELELYPGKHTIEVFGRKRTGQTSLCIEILDDALKVISEFSLDFSDSFLFNFNFEYRKTSTGYIRFYRGERNYGTLEVVKIIVRNIELKDDFKLKKHMTKEEDGRSIISKPKKSKIEVIKEDVRPSKNVRKESGGADTLPPPPVPTAPSRPARERHRGRSEVSVVTSAAEENKEELKKADKEVEEVVPSKIIPEATEQGNVKNNEVIKTTSETPISRQDNRGIPESRAARLKDREQRALARLKNKNSQSEDGHITSIEVSDSNSENNNKDKLSIWDRDRVRKERDARREASRNAKIELRNKILSEREAAKKDLISIDNKKVAPEEPIFPEPEPLSIILPPTVELPVETPNPPYSRPLVSSRNILRLSKRLNSPAAGVESEKLEEPENQIENTDKNPTEVKE